MWKIAVAKHSGCSAVSNEERGMCGNLAWIHATHICSLLAPLSLYRLWYGSILGKEEHPSRKGRLLGRFGIVEWTFGYVGLYGNELCKCRKWQPLSLPFIFKLAYISFLWTLQWCGVEVKGHWKQSFLKLNNKCSTIQLTIFSMNQIIGA